MLGRIPPLHQYLWWWPVPWQLSFEDKHWVLRCFAQAVWEGQFSEVKFRQLQESTVHSTMDNVTQTFSAHYRDDSRVKKSEKLAHLLYHQFWGYKNLDSGVKPQKAHTASILHCMCSLATSEQVDTTMNSLIIGTFFFTMGSCEYSTTKGEKCTKLLTLGNIHFFYGRQEIPHSTSQIMRSHTVSVSFEYQKHDECNDIITQYRTSNFILCPVHQWATIITQIHNYPPATDKTTVNSFLSIKGKLVQIASNAILLKLWAAMTMIGKSELWFSTDKMGWHLICSGAAMAMYVSGVPVFTIMLIGHWSCDAFLHYIRKQVQEFSAGVSGKMMKADLFFMIPEAQHEDPWVSSAFHNFLECNINNGHMMHHWVMQQDPNFPFGIRTWALLTLWPCPLLYWWLFVCPSGCFCTWALYYIARVWVREYLF